MKTHWLYGMGPDKIVEFNVEIDEEHQCNKCVHKAVCRFRMDHFCSNFQFGNSDGKDCQMCTHRFSRHDRKDPLPCFHCKHYKEQA